MKNPIYIIAVLVLTCNFLKAQNVKKELVATKEAVYKYSYVSDSTDSSNPKERFMSLLWGEDGSVFQLQNRHLQDSTILADYKAGKERTIHIIGSLAPINETNYQIYKADNKITTKESYLGNNILFNKEFLVYEEGIEDFDWSIKEDTATVANLLCQKAELNFGGRTWIAWFSSEIPIMDGPYKFQGLPGLIVSIADSQEYFRFDLISFSDVNKTVYNPIRKDEIVMKTTKKGFFSQRAYHRKNMYSILVASGVYSATEENRKKAQKITVEDNNHIEKQ
ncbi:GLPGLI family protein [Sphingobacterium sp. xlx-130]|uniref:GLPGLI family protein n=1 Tax=Sphingobacterium sp. xlx-130 TaxID=2654323 RepID=UPI0013DC3EFF|nr:GLPGLI family protein [Sphingobacterium sp. xlx-130]